MNSPPDFIAELYYRRTEDGGRRTPAKSLYRPHVKFPFSEYLTSGQQRFLDKEWVYPGETVVAEITMLSPHFFTKMLDIGSEFEFGEGPRVIGTGTILEVLNKELLKHEEVQ